MISTAEEIIENIRALPKNEREKVFKFFEVEKIQEVSKSEELKIRSEKFKLALKWIEENKKEYDGQFVVLDGDKLIAVGDDAKTVYAEARAKGIESPFLERIKAKVLPFGGW
jgi:hypothetical protein